MVYNLEGFFIILPSHSSSLFFSLTNFFLFLLGFIFLLINKNFLHGHDNCVAGVAGVGVTQLAKAFKVLCDLCAEATATGEMAFDAPGALRKFYHGLRGVLDIKN